MLEAPYLTPALWSFGIALAALGAFAVQLTLGWRGGLRASMLVGAVGLSALCVAAGVGAAWTGSAFAWQLWRGADIARVAGWVLFVLVVFRAGAMAAPDTRRAVTRGLVAAGIIGAALALASYWAANAAPRAGYAISLGVAVFGLMCVEQLFRNTPPELRWNVKPLCLGLGGLFAFDLFMYAEAVLFGEIDRETWSAHGAVQALVIPFVAVATARNKEWTVSVAFSRRIVLHSTALLVSGLYLLAVAAGGYYIRFFGGSWGATLSITLGFAALVSLGVFLTSGTLRSKLRVFVNKNFFSYRYDYREEWLRFTSLLARHDPTTSIYQRVVQALADLVESPGGAIWMRRGRAFRQLARWNAPEIRADEPADGPLAGFLDRTGWVVDLRESRREPTRYDGLAPPAWLGDWPAAWLAIPLLAGEQLIGIVVLAEARVAVDVNWEVRDLLKTAGRQAASYLGQLEASEALLESEKFAAFNRMSAFVVHDLKNLVAQLALLLKNAERHRDNPEFQRDMLDTVRHVAERMNRMLAQLRLGGVPVENAKQIDLAAIVERVGCAKSIDRRTLRVEAQARVHALGHEDRLEHVVGHLVQNAIDATREDGSILIRVLDEPPNAVLEIVDDGIGMTPEFIQTRLFRPFQTTKRDGMGIGTYESQQYVMSLGGALAVESAPGRGTRVRLTLPQPAAALREVA